jgi:hypothetical protein
MLRMLQTKLEKPVAGVYLMYLYHSPMKRPNALLIHIVEHAVEPLEFLMNKPPEFRTCPSPETIGEALQSCFMSIEILPGLS